MSHKDEQAFLNKRHPRVDRDEVSEIHEDENSHLWAVAYSDLLMVLLSFFILFFSMDQSKKDSLMKQLTRAVSSETSPKSESIQDKNLSDMVFADLKGLNLSVTKEKQALVIHFSNDLYNTSEYKIDGKNQSEIKKVLDTISSYKDQIEIYFEGHADSSLIKKGSQKIIDNNFTLSSLRAINALQFAKVSGFNEKHLFAQGSSSNNRDSRSLSIRIQALAVKSEVKVETQERENL